MISKFFVVVKSGNAVIFEGSMSSFRKYFYDYPDDWSDESVLDNVKEWLKELKWTIELYTCH